MEQFSHPPWGSGQGPPPPPQPRPFRQPTRRPPQPRLIRPSESTVRKGTQIAAGMARQKRKRERDVVEKHIRKRIKREGQQPPGFLERQGPGTSTVAPRSERLSTVAIPATQPTGSRDWGDLIDALLTYGFNNVQSAYVNVSPEKHYYDLTQLLRGGGRSRLDHFPYLKPGHIKPMCAMSELTRIDSVALMNQIIWYRNKQLLKMEIPNVPTGPIGRTDYLEKHLRVIISLNPHLVLYQRNGLCNEDRSILRDTFVTLVSPLRETVSAIDIVTNKVCTNEALVNFLDRTQDILRVIRTKCIMNETVPGLNNPAQGAYFYSIKYAMEFVDLLKIGPGVLHAVRVGSLWDELIPYKTIFSIFMAWWCFKYPYGMPRHAAHLEYEQRLLEFLGRVIVSGASMDACGDALEKLRKFILVPLSGHEMTQMMTFNNLMGLYRTMTLRFGITSWTPQTAEQLNAMNKVEVYHIPQILLSGGQINTRDQFEPGVYTVEEARLQHPITRTLFTPPVLHDGIPTNQRIRCTYLGGPNIEIELGLLYVMYKIPRELYARFKLPHGYIICNHVDDWLIRTMYQLKFDMVKNKDDVIKLTQNKGKGLYEQVVNVTKDGVAIQFKYKILILTLNKEDAVVNDNEFLVALKEFIHETKKLQMGWMKGLPPELESFYATNGLKLLDHKVAVTGTEISINYYSVSLVFEVLIAISTDQYQVTKGRRDLGVSPALVNSANLLLRPSELMLIRWDQSPCRVRPVKQTFRAAQTALYHDSVNVRPTIRSAYWKGYEVLCGGIYSDSSKPDWLFVHRLPRDRAYIVVKIPTQEYIEIVKGMKKVREVEWIDPSQIGIGRITHEETLCLTDRFGGKVAIRTQVDKANWIPPQIARLRGPQSQLVQTRRNARYGPNVMSSSASYRVPMGPQMMEGPHRQVVPPVPGVLNPEQFVRGQPRRRGGGSCGPGRRGQPPQGMPMIQQGMGVRGYGHPPRQGGGGYQYRGQPPQGMPMIQQGMGVRGYGHPPRQGGGGYQYRGQPPQGGRMPPQGRMLMPRRVGPVWDSRSRRWVNIYPNSQPPPMDMPTSPPENSRSVNVNQEADPGHVLLYPRWKGREEELQGLDVTVTEELIEKAEEMPLGYWKLADASSGEPIVMTPASWENAKWMIKQKNQM